VSDLFAFVFIPKSLIYLKKLRFFFALFVTIETSKFQIFQIK